MNNRGLHLVVPKSKKLVAAILIFLLLFAGYGGYLFGYRQGRSFQYSACQVSEAFNAHFELERIFRLGSLDTASNMACFVAHRVPKLISALDQCLQSQACNDYLGQEIGASRISTVLEQAKGLDQSTTCAKGH